MSGNKRLLRVGLIILGCIAFDQLTKLVAIETIKLSPPKYYLGGFFVLKYAENTGAMLGFGSDLPEDYRFWFLTVLVGILLAVLLVYLLFASGLNRIQTIALALIAGGGISNFIDRVLNDGRVVDFMHIDTGIWILRTGIFNFADVAIMVGLGLMLVWGRGEQESPEIEGATAGSEPQRQGNDS